MSDVFQGPGSWMASDGKWYPPEHHPDPAYRQRFTAVVAEPELAPQPVVQMGQAAEPAVIEHPTAEMAPPAGAPEVVPSQPEVVPTHHEAIAETTTHRLNDEPPEPSVDLRDVEVQHVATNPVPAAVHETAEHTISPLATNGVAAPYAAETAELSSTQLDAEMSAVTEQRAALAEPTVVADVAPTPEALSPTPPPVAPTPEPAKPLPVVEPPKAERDTFSVASSAFTNPAPVEERPQFTDTRPASVVEPPPRQSVGRTELELDRRPEESTNTEFKITAAPTDTYTSPSTEIVPYTGPSFGESTVRSRIISAVLFLSGVALIAGSFLDWTVGDVIESGWQRGDGIITMVSGIIGSAMAGPIFVGFRHVLPKAVSIVAGVVCVIVLGLVAVNSVLGPTTSGVDFGLGFFVTLAGAVFMTAAGASDRGEENY